MIWDSDLVFGKQIWDGAVEAMFGYSPEEVGAHPAWWDERIHPEDSGRVLAKVEPSSKARRSTGPTSTASGAPTARTRR